MRAAVLDAPGRLELRDIPMPEPGPGQLRLRVRACAACRTDLHILDGELSEPKLPLVMGHQIVGDVDALGAGVDRFELGDRVGVPWLGKACGLCPYCVAARENLCDAPVFTGYSIDGGFAEACVADADFAYALPQSEPPSQLAPLLCAGLIGYRALRMAGDARRIGFYGFGAAAHILCQVARHRGCEVFAFTRPGDDTHQRFARELGAVWAGGSNEVPPTPLDAALIFAPVGALVPVALAQLRKGGVVVCAGIHMSDIPSFPYAALWGERQIRSVANLTRRDGQELLALAPIVPIRSQVTEYALAEVGRALDDLRRGRVAGAAVVVP